uniref:Uncharacterized protein n=1 Tax=Sphaerodactylus townsendi TaxID=933632 RepID=A0ACB8E6M9_9SAUR
MDLGEVLEQTVIEGMREQDELEAATDIFMARSGQLMSHLHSRMSPHPRTPMEQLDEPVQARGGDSSSGDSSIAPPGERGGAADPQQSSLHPLRRARLEWQRRTSHPSCLIVTATDCVMARMDRWLAHVEQRLAEVERRQVAGERPRPTTPEPPVVLSSGTASATHQPASSSTSSRAPHVPSDLEEVILTRLLSDGGKIFCTHTLVRLNPWERSQAHPCSPSTLRSYGQVGWALTGGSRERPGGWSFARIRVLGGSYVYGTQWVTSVQGDWWRDGAPRLCVEEAGGMPVALIVTLACPIPPCSPAQTWTYQLGQLCCGGAALTGTQCGFCFPLEGGDG